MKALPVFDKEKGAIYLQEMEVVDATVAPEKMQSILQTLDALPESVPAYYFNQQPIFCVKTAARAKRWRKNMPKVSK
jgi:hypothetical protein